MGHDIYSLGVCLLEIGFWKPLVVRHGNEGEASTNDLSPTFREAVHSLDSSMINDESSLQNLAKPVFVRQAILQLTRQNLPLSTRNGYAKVVMNCLTCLDNAEQKEILTGDRVRAEIEFNKMVLQPLSDIDF